jgi:signal transduction histidine kinase
MYIAVLGHDLRTPLSAIAMSAQFMIDAGELKEPNLELATTIARSSRRMNHMVTDLLDFTRSRLGTGIPIVRRPMDLAVVAAHAVKEMAAAEPQSVFEFEASGDVSGVWDGARVSQVVANLVGNAVQHGAVNSPIRVSARGEAADVVLRVHNGGPAISATDMHGLFSPFKQARHGAVPTHDSTNLGLGLYIAERIVTAHGGTIVADSSEDAGTTLTVRLPRRSDEAHALPRG